MATYFRPGSPSKLTLEQDDFIYEATDPQITLTMDFDRVVIEATCWNLTTRQKENVDILDSFEQELKKEKKNKKDPHPDYDYCECEDSLAHRDAVGKEMQEVKKAKKKLKSRTDRFPKDGGKPIKASVPGYTKIPWTKGTLTLVAQSPDGQIHYAKTMAEKRAVAWGNFKWILVCWPGQYTQDIFLIDDMKAFRLALGFKPKTEPEVVTDEDGNEWLFDALFTPKTDRVNLVPKSTTFGYGVRDWS